MVEDEVAKAIADQLRVKLTGHEEQVVDAETTAALRLTMPTCAVLVITLKRQDHLPMTLPPRNILEKQCV